MRRIVPALCAIVMLTAFTAEGPVVDGKGHGNWVTRSAGGEVHQGPYVDGKQHGNWTVRSSSGCGILEFSAGVHVGWSACGR